MILKVCSNYYSVLEESNYHLPVTAEGEHVNNYRHSLVLTE